MSDLNYITKMLTDLCAANSTPGNENEVCDVISEYFGKKYESEKDALGNLIVRRKGNGIRFLLDAHTDQIGLVVTYIADSGFLKVGACGGVDTRVFNATEVVVHGKKDIKGIITSVPPHLSKNSDENKASDISEISIDIGMKKEEAEKVVSLGDRVTFCTEPLNLLNNRFSSPAIDNRAGVAALILTSELLEKSNCDADITFLFSTREETGGSGAQTGSFSVECDEAISVDVSFATCPGVDKTKAGELSKGPMICISSSLDNKISNDLILVSEKYGILHQLEVCPSRTGTNADQISVSGIGKRTGLVSVPLRNMHTCVEIVSLDDIYNTAKLLAKYIEERVREDV